MKLIFVSLIHSYAHIYSAGGRATQCKNPNIPLKQCKFIELVAPPLYEIYYIPHARIPTGFIEIWRNSAQFMAFQWNTWTFPLICSNKQNPPPSPYSARMQMYFNTALMFVWLRLQTIRKKWEAQNASREPECSSTCIIFRTKSIVALILISIIVLAPKLLFASCWPYSSSTHIPIVRYTSC